MTMRNGSSGSYAFVTSTPAEAVAHSSSSGGGTSGTYYPSGYYNSTVKYDVTWEHPVSWGKLQKYFVSIGDNNAKIAFSILEENAKSLEDHLDVAYLKTSGGTVYGTANLAGDVNILGTLRIEDVPVTSLLPPTGSIMPYAGNIAPGGWLLCDGLEYSQTLYAGLYAVCGTKFNTSAGQSSPSSGNFRVPILTGRFPLGDNSSTALGDSGGASTVTLSTSQMPSHTHTQSAHGHGMTIPTSQTSSTSHTHQGTTRLSMATTGATNTTYDIYTDNATVTNDNTGGGGSHENMPPYLVLNYIIKT